MRRNDGKYESVRESINKSIIDPDSLYLDDIVSTEEENSFVEENREDKFQAF